MMNKQKAESIADQYNKRMKHLYKKDDRGQLKYHSSDVSTIMDEQFSDMWEEAEPFLDHCESIWESEKNLNNKLEDVQFPSIGVFSRWGMLKKLCDRIDGYKIKDIAERSRIIYENQDLLVDYISTEGYSLSMSSPVDIEIYKGDPKYGDSYVTEAKRKEIIHSISQRIKNLLNI